MTDTELFNWPESLLEMMNGKKIISIKWLKAVIPHYFFIDNQKLNYK